MRFRSRRSAWPLRLLVAVLLAMGGLPGCSSDEAVFPAVTLSPESQVAMAGLVGSVDQILNVEPTFVSELASGAGSALLGYALARGTQLDGNWTMNVAGVRLAEDRAALGLLELSIPFERSEQGKGPVTGPGNLLDTLEGMIQTGHLIPDLPVVLAAVAEVGGNRAGRLAIPGEERELYWLESLAHEAGLRPERRGAAPVELWLTRVEDLEFLAAQPTLCAQRVPVIGGAGCLRPEPSPVSLLELDRAAADWMAATTGPLGPHPDSLPASVDGGVGWNNHEAQAYQPEGVSFDGSLSLWAAPVAQPDVAVLPFTSGMVVSRQAYGYGTYEFDIVLPEGTGLWPAIWLLDSEACESPGRCAGYTTNAYHEIDLLETRGQEPDELFASVHWWDGAIRSESTTTRIDGLNSQERTIALERRPGLLIWSLDGREIARVGGRAEASIGLHRSAPMRIVINLAVGGTFAGDRLIGRNGLWWGDAMVPNSFPDLGWSQAVFRVDGIRFIPLG